VRGKWDALAKPFHFFTEGGISVETQFQFKPEGSDDNRPYMFRTTIQIDGDVTSVLPPPDLFVNDPNWSRLYEEEYRLHRNRLDRALSQSTWTVRAAKVGKLASIAAALLVSVWRRDIWVWLHATLALSVFWLFFHFFAALLFKLATAWVRRRVMAV
jgi:hypothetical protein